MPEAVEEQLRAAYGAGGSAAFFQTALELEIARTGEDCTGSPLQAVTILALAGEPDRMFTCLQPLLDQGISPPVGWRTYDPYRSDPRFQDLLRRIGLPDS